MASGYLYAFFSSLLEKFRPSPLAALLLFLHFLQRIVPSAYCTITRRRHAPRCSKVPFPPSPLGFLPRLPAPRSEQPMTRKPSLPCARAEHTAPGGRRRKRSAELWMWIEQIWSRDGDWREGERRILRKRMHVCTVSTHRAGAKRCQNLQGVGGAALHELL